MPLLLTRADVQSVLTMADALAAVEEGFRRLGLEKVVMPQRTAIRIPEHHGLHLGMPAYIGPAAPDDPLGGALALKVVTVYPDNPGKHGLPTTIGTLLLNDPRTGALVAIMDAGFLTATRTGAASGVATKHLARADARTAGVFGAGIQARAQLSAIALVRRIERAVVCDVDPAAREKYAREMGEQLGFPIEATDDAKRCVANDIVVAATSSRTPLVEGSLLRPGTHVNGIGAHSPDAREFDTLAIRRSKFVADHAPACLAEAGELMIPIAAGELSAEHIHASLGQIIAGIKPGRTADDEITFFKSVGLAVQDAAVAARVYELARAKGVGAEVRI
jgi:ornithine cyclodeaminase/alanine dehydrogenase